jgi:alpha-1,3-glucosyltransferase
MALQKAEALTICAALSVKLLLFPAYVSTDASVHAHWQALTRCKHLCEWYTDESTENTLDYPPLFALFERLLASISAIALSAGPSRDCVTDLRAELSSLCNPLPKSSIYFLRASVLASEVLLVSGSLALCSAVCIRNPLMRSATLFCTLLSPSLLFVDNIHLQYNGAVTGLLMLALSLPSFNKYVLSSLTFSVLVHTKHLLAYAAPPLVAHLLLQPHGHHKLSLVLKSGAQYASVALFTTTISLGPFWYCGVLDVLFFRLAPFGRGLVHAFWAPNLWAIYLAVEKAITATTFGRTGSFAGGLLGQSDFHSLPSPNPTLCFALVALGALPGIASAAVSSRTVDLVRSVCQALSASFMVGWHVHEKAAIMFTLPLVPLSFITSADAKTVVALSTLAGYSVHHLLHEPREQAVKAVSLLFSHIATQQLGVAMHGKAAKLNRAEHVYFASLVTLEVYCITLHPSITYSLPYLPNILRSVVAALGMMYVHGRLTIQCVALVAAKKEVRMNPFDENPEEMEEADEEDVIAQDEK